MFISVLLKLLFTVTKFTFELFYKVINRIIVSKFSTYFSRLKKN